MDITLPDVINLEEPADQFAWNFGVFEPSSLQFVVMMLYVQPMIFHDQNKYKSFRLQTGCQCALINPQKPVQIRVGKDLIVCLSHLTQYQNWYIEVRVQYVEGIGIWRRRLAFDTRPSMTLFLLLLERLINLQSNLNNDTTLQTHHASTRLLCPRMNTFSNSIALLRRCCCTVACSIGDKQVHDL